NVAPCLMGGIIISLCEDKKVIYHRLQTDLKLKFIVAIPDFELSTAAVRKILPEKIDFNDAVFNASHLAFLNSGLTDNRPDLLKLSLKDKLHQPYRGKLIPGFEEI